MKLLEVVDKDESLKTFVNIKGRKDIHTLIDLVMHRPTLEVWEELELKLLRSKPFQETREALKGEYYISHIEHYYHYYWDCYDSDVYLLNWRKHRYQEVELPVGARIYHLTKEANVDSVLKNGLRPSKFSQDGVYYGAEKVFFSLVAIVDENADYIDAHLRGRTQIEVTYDGTYKLYVDAEYNHRTENPMVYCLTESPIPVDGVSKVQPIRKKWIQKIDITKIKENVLQAAF